MYETPKTSFRLLVWREIYSLDELGSSGSISTVALPLLDRTVQCAHICVTLNLSRLIYDSGNQTERPEKPLRNPT